LAHGWIVIAALALRLALHCYTGNGVTVVNLPDVREAQIIGLHNAFLLLVSAKKIRVTEPSIPPIHVFNPTVYA
jgi:hypothetical protein